MVILQSYKEVDPTNWNIEKRQEVMNLYTQFKELKKDIKAYAKLVTYESYEGELTESFKSYELILDGNIEIRKDCNDVIGFFHNGFRTLEYVKRYDIAEKLKDIKKPNRVKVLNNRVIKNQIDYENACFKVCKEIDNEKIKAVNDFLKEIEGLEGLIQSKDKTSGCATGKTVEYSYEIYDRGYIEEKIRLVPVYSEGALELYKKLEDK